MFVTALVDAAKRSPRKKRNRAAGTIRAAGLELVPTFRRPHYTVLLPELDSDIERLLRCNNEIRRNPHFRSGGLEP